MLGRTTSSCPVRAHWAHQRVDGQLHSSKQGKPISHDFKSSAVKGLMAKSRSRTTTFVVTLAPASRQIFAAANSTANPRLDNSLACAHAARWWPKVSSWRPHRQTCADGGRGRRRRRRSNRRNKWGSRRETGRHQCKRRSGKGVSLNLVINSASPNRRSTRDAASCCQPVRHPSGSSSGDGGGRAPFARSTHHSEALCAFGLGSQMVPHAGRFLR